MKAIIQGMKPLKEKPWEGPNGAMWFVEGTFTDGSVFSVGAKSIEKAKSVHEQLQGLVGKQQEYEVKSRADSRDGTKQWGLVSWPGKAPPQGPFAAARAAGGGYQPRFRDSEEAFHEEGRRIARSVALQQAVVFVSQHGSQESVKSVLEAADGFFSWLYQPPLRKAEVDNPPPASPAKQQSFVEQEAPAPKPPPAKTSGGSYDNPACPNCGAKGAVCYDRAKDEYYCWRKKDTELFDLEGNTKKGCGHKWNKLAEEPLFERIMARVKSAGIAKSLVELSNIQHDTAEDLMVNKLTIDEASWINEAIEAAKKAMLSQASYVEWFNKQVSQAQDKGPPAF